MLLVVNFATIKDSKIGELPAKFEKSSWSTRWRTSGIESPTLRMAGEFLAESRVARRHSYFLLADTFIFHIAGFRFSAYLESMKTTIDIPDAALADAMRFTGAKTKREAVVKALEAYNRQQRVNDLIASFGTLDFATNDEIEAGDLEEIALREAKGSAS